MKKTLWMLLVVIYLIPIFIYSYVFGFGIWKTNDDWAKMGSALGGIYSPIISLTTLILLYRQQKFSEKTQTQKAESDYIQRANSKCESYITLAGAQQSKLDDSEIIHFRNMLESYVVEKSDNKKESIFHELNVRYRPQLASLSRVGSTIHHMRNSKISLTGQISDLRVYAASLIDIELLLAYDEFHRNYIGDDSYYSFEPSPEEQDRIDREIENLRKRK